MLKINELTIGYKNKNRRNILCSGLNLSLRKGELICLLGANGSGKTTLLKTLSGIQPPLSGVIMIEEKDLSHISPSHLAHILAVLPSESIRTGSMTVFDVVATGRIPHTNWLGMLSFEDKQIINHALKCTGFCGDIHTPVEYLSDGQWQQVLLAKSLSQVTPIMILDEPVIHLDIPGKLAMFQSLHSFCHTMKKSILLATHQLQLALAFADKLWVINRQHTIDEGLPEELVLNRCLERAFSRGMTVFDQETGGFHLPQKYICNIGFSGNGEVGNWTKKALRRKGYQPIENRNTPFFVEIKNDNSTWIFREKNILPQSFHRLSDLLDHMDSSINRTTLCDM